MYGVRDSMGREGERLAMDDLKRLDTEARAVSDDRATISSRKG